MSDLCKAFENENGILKERLMHQKQGDASFAK